MQVEFYKQAHFGLGVQWHGTATSWKVWIGIYLPFCLVTVCFIPRYSDEEKAEMLIEAKKWRESEV